MEILVVMLWQFPKEKVWNDWRSRGMFPSLFPFIGVSSRWRKGNIFQTIEEIFCWWLRKYYQIMRKHHQIIQEILSNNWGNIIKLFRKYFQMIEDLGAGMFPSLFPFIGVSSRWRKGNIILHLRIIYDRNIKKNT